ncbi:hypothetical protein HYZ78_02195 [Candidatus Microgenomates bacterium]|nr:hypothetical protein [Candidatus Microgenomates bacterium]
MAISLLPHDRGQVHDKAGGLGRNIGAGFLAGYLVVMGIVGGIFLYVGLQQKNLVQKHEAFNLELKDYQDKEKKMVLLKDRLATLANLSQTLGFRQALDILPGLTGQNLTVENVNLSSGNLKITITASDTFELEELVENINKSSSLVSATLESLELDTTGEFMADLAVEVK